VCDHPSVATFHSFPSILLQPQENCIPTSRPELSPCHSYAHLIAVTAYWFNFLRGKLNGVRHPYYYLLHLRARYRRHSYYILLHNLTDDWQALLSCALLMTSIVFSELQDHNRLSAVCITGMQHSCQTNMYCS
jgi:hypothetical protein